MVTAYRNPRFWLALALALALGPGTWLRSPVAAPNHAQVLGVQAIDLPNGCCALGPLRLERAWRLDSPNEAFHGYSALVSMHPGELTAISDRGYALTIRVNGDALRLERMQPVIAGGDQPKNDRDVEAATFDPTAKRVWIALEGRNAVAWLGADLIARGFRRPPQMRGWPVNTGPEAMVRLADGRFLVLSEDFAPGWFERRLHPALLFAGAPDDVRPGIALRFAGAPGYSPTDIAELPDGRVLVLMRKLVWPFPARFADKLMVADPAEIRTGGVWTSHELGSFAAPMPVDNYEGLAITPRADGMLDVWVISDDNQAVTQATYLLRFALDPRRLPAAR